MRKIHIALIAIVIVTVGIIVLQPSYPSIERINRSESGIQSDRPTYEVSFPSGTFTPSPGIDPTLRSIIRTTSLERIHVIAQFSHPLSSEESDRLRSEGLEPIEDFYSPGEMGHTMFVSVAVKNMDVIAGDPIVLWLGPILPADKNPENQPNSSYSDYAHCLDDQKGMALMTFFFPDTPQRELERLQRVYNFPTIYTQFMQIGVCFPPERIPQLVREEYVSHVKAFSYLGFA